MIELTLICYTCGYERIISEREFIEDIQKCSNRGSENIEITPTKEDPQEKLIDPSERKRIVQRRFIIILVIGSLFLLVGFLLINLGWLMIALLIIGGILFLIAFCWLDTNTPSGEIKEKFT